MYNYLFLLLTYSLSSTVLKTLHSNEEVQKVFITNLLQPYDGEILFHPAIEMDYPHFGVTPRFQFQTPGSFHLITREANYTLAKDGFDLEFIGFCNVTAVSENSLTLMIFDTQLSADTISPSSIPLISFGPQGETLQVCLKVITEINETVEERIVRLTTPPPVTFNDGCWHHYKFTLLKGVATLYFDNAIVCEVPANFTDASIWTFVDGNLAAEAKLPPHPTITAVSLRGHRGDAVPTENETAVECNNTMQVAAELCVNCGRMQRWQISKQFRYLSMEPARALWLEKRRRYEAEREDIRLQLMNMPPRNVTISLRKAYVNSLLHQYLIDRYSKFTIALICLSFLVSFSLIIASSYFLLQEQDKRIKKQREEAKLKKTQKQAPQRPASPQTRTPLASSSQATGSSTSSIHAAQQQSETPRQRLASPFPKATPSASKL